MVDSFLWLFNIGGLGNTSPLYLVEGAWLSAVTLAEVLINGLYHNANGVYRISYW